jgi:hypothetical protein
MKRGKLADCAIYLTRVFILYGIHLASSLFYKLIFMSMKK